MGGLPVVSVEDTVRVEHGDQLEDVFATQNSSPGIVLSATTRCIAVSLSKFLHLRYLELASGSGQSIFFTPDQLPSTRVLT